MESNEEKGEEPLSDMFQWTMAINYNLPPGTNVDKRSAKVMTWSAEKKRWDDENVTETDYDPETGKIKFRSLHFAPTALVQNSYGEFPLKEWSLSPQGPEVILLKIKGLFSELSIEIINGKCRLVSPNFPQIQDPSGSNLLPPLFLFKRLSQYGYNFIAPKSLKGVEIGDWIIKNPKAEESCHRGISSLFTNFHFKSSPYNRIVQSNKTVFQFRRLDSDSVIYSY